MKAFFLHSEGRHKQAIINIGSTSLCLMDEFSNEETNTGKEVDIYFYAQLDKFRELSFSAQINGLALKKINKWSYKAFGQLSWSDDGAVIDCGLIKVLHPRFLSPYRTDIMGKNIIFDIKKLVGFKLKHRTFTLTSECHLENFDDWSIEYVEKITRIDSFKLSDEHWAVINFCHQYYIECQISPPIRVIKKEISKKLGLKQNGFYHEYLNQLFPLGFGWQVFRYAGIPRPISAYLDPCVPTKHEKLTNASGQPKVSRFLPTQKYTLLCSAADAKPQRIKMDIPSKQECFFIIEMIKSRLLDYTYTQAWADKLLLRCDVPPSWLCDISMKQYQGDILTAIREFVFSEPFEQEPPGIEKFHVACLFLRYERRELSWATFLEKTGEILDSYNGDLDCETPYYYLNLYEDAYFSLESEDETKKKYLSEHSLLPMIEFTKQKFEKFRKLPRANKI